MTLKLENEVPSSGLQPQSGGERSGCKPLGGSSYLETKGNTVDGPTAETPGYVVHACGCKSWFCERCCLSLGLSLRSRLTETIKKFESLMMWTLTIDPTLFADPSAAFSHARSKRAVSELIRALTKRKRLLTRHYFYVVEWQERTEMPHWHLLVNAKHVPFTDVCEIWNRNRPVNAGPVTGSRPGFGSVQFSKRDFKDSIQAANYATKYLVKFPDYGYPNWVLDNPETVRRYGTSRGFWNIGSESKPSHPKINGDKTAAKSTRPRINKTIRERVARCDENGVILRRIEERTADGEIKQSYSFADRLVMPFKDFKDSLDPERQSQGRIVEITPFEAAKFSGSLGVTGRNISKLGFANPNSDGTVHPRKAA